MIFPRLGWARAGVTIQRIDIYLLAEALPRYACAFLRTPHERRISVWPKLELGFYGAEMWALARRRARRAT